MYLGMLLGSLHLFLVPVSVQLWWGVLHFIRFQEIVPLNAGNILGSEDSGPSKKWLALIRKTLNNLSGTNGGSGACTPSPIPRPVVENNADFEGSVRRKASDFFHRRSFQTTQSWGMENDPPIGQPRLDRRFSVCDRVILSHRPSDYGDQSFRWARRPSDYTRPSDFSRLSDYDQNHRHSYHRPSNYSRASDYSKPSDYDPNYRYAHRPSDCSRSSDYHSRLSDYSRPSDYSRWGSSDDDNNGLGDSPSTVLYSSMLHGGAKSYEEGNRVRGNSRYCLVASKQMVGIFLTVWVRSELRDHVRNMKVSCVGRGLMGYLGNKVFCCSFFRYQNVRM